MSLTTPGRTWDGASSPSVSRLAARYEAAWRAEAVRRPDPADYLPSNPRERASVLLALLRTDLALRWEEGDRVRVEWYGNRYPDLGGEALVALLYEEYCLREEAGDAPDLAEYRARFPEVAPLFRELLEIHDLVGSGRTAIAKRPSPPAIPFPEVGQTIAGFKLVEELGRGAFARVFRAEERQLADRPVALKVARAGSREPQTLARLQHTHIVPVYSYRTDPVTGLHLLCMPYLGRVTLAQVLADPRTRALRSGVDLVAALDRLQPSDDAPARRPAGRLALSRRNYPRAIAWWGARLAEALQHAHDRGVLHRDIKPSNVLVTADGLPLLLDFNLAQEPWLDDPGVAPAALGGTLAYMAPEHLEALAEGVADRVDGRSDLYALGVVLFEALAHGARPFPIPSATRTAPEVLRLEAEARRAGAPRLRASHPEVPPSLDAVVRRCLAPEPGDRYASAADLAADLQAVADDGPLRFAREPQPARALRWLRRHRRRLAVAAPLVLALTIVTLTLANSRVVRVRLKAEVEHGISEGAHAVEEDRLDLAADQFATAARLAGGDAALGALGKQARDRYDLARRAKANRDRADELFRRAEHLRFRLLGFSGDPRAASQAVEAALLPFDLPRDTAWTTRPDRRLLDDARRTRLFEEVNDLLFLWVVALDRDRPGDAKMARRAVAICDAALAFARPVGPWRALRQRYASPSEGRSRLGAPAAESSARACFQCGLILYLEGRPDAAIAWLERAALLQPGDYWSQFYLAYRHDRADHPQEALSHYNVAIALRPGAPWARYNRARLLRSQGAWDQALDDLGRALEAARDVDFPEARLELGIVDQFLGDGPGARAAYDAVIASGAGGFYARAARLNRAKLDLDAGAIDRAEAEYESLLAEDPRDSAARLGRALLSLRLGRADRAEADLTLLLQAGAEDPAELYAHRSRVRLTLGRLAEAASDAASALRLRATPSHERLWVRTLLASGRDRDLLWLDRPDDVARLPCGGAALMTDLRAVAEKLRRRASHSGPTAALAHRTRAVLLSALGDSAADAEAEAAASRAVVLAPFSAEAHLVRARVRRRSGDRLGALADVERGLTLEPDAPRLLELRGILATEAGRPDAALRDLNRAILRGAEGTIRIPRAQALMDLGRAGPALDDWSRALAYDPEDPRAYLGRARVSLRLGRWDQAVADLERAADWAGDRDVLMMARITLLYAACLPERPNRLPRVVTFARRAWDAATVAGFPRRSEAPEADPAILGVPTIKPTGSGPSPRPL